MLSHIKQANIPFILLIAQIAKSFMYPVSIYDGIVLVSLSVLFGFKLYLDHIKKPDFSQEIMDKFEEYKEYNETKLKNSERHNTERIDELSGKISGLTFHVKGTPRKQEGNPYGW